MPDELDLEPIKDYWGRAERGTWYAPETVAQVQSLIAEVERLRAENESLQHEYDEAQAIIGRTEMGDI